VCSDQITTDDARFASGALETVPGAIGRDSGGAPLTPYHRAPAEAASRNIALSFQNPAIETLLTSNVHRVTSTITSIALPQIRRNCDNGQRGIHGPVWYHCIYLLRSYGYGASAPRHNHITVRSAAAYHTLSLSMESMRELHQGMTRDWDTMQLDVPKIEESASPSSHRGEHLDEVGAARVKTIQTKQSASLSFPFKPSNPNGNPNGNDCTLFRD
jgi:hypothetical protein